MKRSPGLATGVSCSPTEPADAPSLRRGEGRPEAGGMKAPGAGARRVRTGLLPAALAFALACASPAAAQTAVSGPAVGPPAFATEAFVRGLEARIEELERRLGASALLDLVARVDRLAKEIQVLRDRTEIDAHTLDGLRDRQQDLYAELDRLAQRVALPVPEMAEAQAGASDPPAETDTGTGAGSATGAAAAPGPRERRESGAAAAPEREPPGAAGSGDEDPGTAPEPEGEPAPDPVEEQERYRIAFDLLSEGRFEDAATAFAGFLDAFPASRRRDDARFWTGECLYALRRFEPALDEFRRLVEDHPDSSRVPGARLKIGFILHELGRSEEAAEELRALVEAAPDTSEAKLARDRLERLR